MKYRQITSDERYMLSRLRTQGFTQAEIARCMQRHPSTISRELKRNRAVHDGWYRAEKAIEKANGRRSRSRRNRRFTLADFRRVENLLVQQWSPEQISGYLRRHNLLSISHETIYRYSALTIDAEFAAFPKTLFQCREAIVRKPAQEASSTEQRWERDKLPVAQRHLFVVKQGQGGKVPSDDGNGRCRLRWPTSCHRDAFNQCSFLD